MHWLSPKDSNLEHPESESGALPIVLEDNAKIEVPRRSLAQHLGTLLQRTNTCYQIFRLIPRVYWLPSLLWRFTFTVVFARLSAWLSAPSEHVCLKSKGPLLF